MLTVGVLRRLLAKIPPQPTWRTVNVVLFVVFVGGVIIAAVVWSLGRDVDKIRATQTSITRAQLAAEVRGYKNRAVGCMDIINDGEIMLTEECTFWRVALYYPPDICDKLAASRISARRCGDEAIVVNP